ncbi:MAG: UDP-N-acetylmuramate dehydrogenase [bacterium]|nr:UDP-N-acetylmuramate dehydrogenase [bacterium]
MPFEITENVTLAPFTTYKIGGPARYFCRVHSYDELKEALIWSHKNEIPFVVIGGGSNLLVHDEGFDGLVIKMEDRGISIKGTLIEAGAGAVLATVAYTASEAGLSGLEWAFGVPGTIGGAVRGNAGAFGSDMSEIVVDVEVIDTEKGTVFHLSPQEIGYGYRTSRFKKEPTWLITRALFQMNPDDSAYCMERVEEFLEKKNTSQPTGKQCAGSVFQNPPISDLSRISEVPVEFLSRERIPVGWLLEQCNLKGHVIGQACISTKHANFFVNLGGATYEDMAGLIRFAKDRVASKFGILLKEEIQYIGNPNTVPLNH